MGWERLFIAGDVALVTVVLCNIRLVTALLHHRMFPSQRKLTSAGLHFTRLHPKGSCQAYLLLFLSSTMAHFPRIDFTDYPAHRNLDMGSHAIGNHPDHEKDPRWTAVDDYAEAHLRSHAIHDDLEYAAKAQKSNGLPDIAVSRMQGKFLALQCRMMGAKHVLEVGTLGGYSTIWLASASPDIRIASVEVNEHHASVARASFKHAGLEDRIEVLVGAGVDVLPKIRQEVESGQRPKFDFVFIDADKPNGLNYLNESIPMSRTGACIIVDNVVRKGQLANAEVAKTDGNVQGGRIVVEAAGKDQRIDATLLQTVGEKNYDGMLICVVN